MVQRGAVRLDHIGPDEQVADILTKPLGKVKFLTSVRILVSWNNPMMWVSLDDELWELWGALGIASRSYKHSRG